MSGIIIFSAGLDFYSGRIDTVGPPLAGVEVRIDDDGEILVRGELVMQGYWRNPEATAEAFTADGYLRTGDLSSIDEDGYVAIVGRAKDLIITGGLNVYPKEVEEVIDAIDGVVESAVFGVPHADFGEAVTAAVVNPGSAHRPFRENSESQAACCFDRD